MRNKNIPNSIANYAFIINNCCLIARRTGSLGAHGPSTHHPVITINFQPQGQWTSSGFGTWVICVHLFSGCPRQDPAGQDIAYPARQPLIFPSFLRSSKYTQNVIWPIINNKLNIIYENIFKQTF